MNSENINQRLIQEYNFYLEHLRSIYSDELQKNISLPFFIHVSDNYLKAKKRVMIIGQETGRWYSNLIDKQYDTKKIIECYRKFDMGKEHNRSPFWQFVNLLNTQINGDVALNSILWSNLSRFDYCGKKVPEEINEKNKQGFQLLKKEIQITKPEIIVFTTCHARDKYIKQAYPNLKVEDVTGFSNKFLGRLVAPKLPMNTFRTYHPNYLNRQKSKPNIKRVVNGPVSQF